MPSSQCASTRHATHTGTTRLTASCEAPRKSVEFLTPASTFGFRISGRPFVEVAFASGGTAVGGGALLELACNFYAH